jgi:hypothetical protein
VNTIYLKKTLVLLGCFVVGSAGYWVVVTWPVMHQLGQLAVAAWQAWYAKIGIVLLGLAPMTAYLVVLAGWLLCDRLGLLWLSVSAGKHLSFIIEVGPMLGILGTMIALSQVMISIDLSNGLQAAIRQMTALIGHALNSSIYGIGLALAACILRHVTDEEG